MYLVNENTSLEGNILSLLVTSFPKLKKIVNNIPLRQEGGEGVQLLNLYFNIREILRAEGPKGLNNFKSLSSF